MTKSLNDFIEENYEGSQEEVAKEISEQIQEAQIDTEEIEETLECSECGKEVGEIEGVMPFGNLTEYNCWGGHIEKEVDTESEATITQLDGPYCESCFEEVENE